jgi:transcriptional regulator with XRE-family HTH domain
MPLAVLARKSGVSMPSVARILSGRHATARFDNVAAVAEALGMDVELIPRVQEQDLREEQARLKAERLMALLQGTSGLEAQALDQATLDRMKRQTMHELLAGSRFKLWGD